MKLYLSVLAISALMLTGCSTPNAESKPEYDDLDLMVYQLCIEKIVDGYLDKGFFLMVPTYIETAEQECSGLKPLKK